MYKTINGWTKAKMIEQIKLRNNSTKSMEESGFCMYRGPNNNACAVGCFIPDELYVPRMEKGYPARSLVREFINIRDSMPLDPYGLAAMQNIHDYNAGDTQTRYRYPQLNVVERLTAWINENVED